MAPKVLISHTDKPPCSGISISHTDDDHKELPIVDIFEHPGIWVCLDEGCNSSCHGKEWADNADAK